MGFVQSTSFDHAVLCLTRIPSDGKTDKDERCLFFLLVLPQISIDDSVDDDDHLASSTTNHLDPYFFLFLIDLHLVMLMDTDSCGSTADSINTGLYYWHINIIHSFAAVITFL